MKLEIDIITLKKSLTRGVLALVYSCSSSTSSYWKFSLVSILLITIMQKALNSLNYKYRISYGPFKGFCIKYNVLIALPDLIAAKKF